MKQGQASSSKMGSTKVEPTSRAVSPGAVSRMGIHPSPAKPEPLYEGRGLKAPMVSTATHKGGSQGKY